MNYEKWKSSGFACTYTYPGLVNQLLSPIKIHSIPEISTSKTEKVFDSVALWDTGATTSAIDAEIAKELGLIPTDKCTVYHAQGISEDVPAYSFMLELQGGLKVKVVNATEGHFDLENFGMLLGMDIMLQGDLFFGQKDIDGKACSFFTFSIPAIGRDIDFVKELNNARKAEISYIRYPHKKSTRRK